MCRNPIGSFGKDGRVVPRERETFPPTLLLPLGFDAPQADFFLPPINWQAILREDFEAQVVKRLVAVPVRPPEPRGPDLNGRAREFFEEGTVVRNRSPILNWMVRRELRL